MLESIGKFLSSGENLVLFMVVLPIFSGFLLWLLRKQYILRVIVGLAASVANLVFALGLYSFGEFTTKIEYTPLGFEFSMRVTELSALFLTVAAVAFTLVILYSIIYTKENGYNGLYLFFLLFIVTMVNGVLLSESLGLTLFFWEALLIPVFAVLLLKNKKEPKTAVKAITLVGLADLMLMLGIIITTHLSENSVNIESNITVSGAGVLGFCCIIFGAFGLSGSMPFHSWMPDAAEDAPTPFMAAFPGVIQMILGGYLSIRTIQDYYAFVPGSTVSIVIMVIGAITVISGAAMALVQTDLKRLVSYISISQVGFIVIGIGSGLDNGIFGGIFGMINSVICITGLFMIAGIIEKATGTTDLKQLGGLWKKMPLPAISFILLALSLGGFPVLSGFISKGFIFDAALKTNIAFYICALIGTFLVALTLLKTIHSLFFGAVKLPKEIKETEKASPGLLIPVCVLAVACISVGVYFMTPFLEVETSSKLTSNFILSAMFIAVWILAILDHSYGLKKAGKALDSTEHIRQMPILKSIYNTAEKGKLDPYNWLMTAVNGYASLCTYIEHGVSWIYDKGVPGSVKAISLALHRFDNGRLSRYMYLAVGGVAVITIIFLLTLK